MTQMVVKKQKMAIIGAGFAGLTLARLLKDNQKISCDVFEARSANDDLSNYNGEVRLPSFVALQNRLQLNGVRLDDNFLISRARILTALKQNLKNFHYQCQISRVVEGPEDSYNFFVATEGTRYGPFDIVVVADGVKSPFRKLPFVYCIGDARWVADVWYDFGFTRINKGADIAMRDAMEVERALMLHDLKQLNRFRFQRNYTLMYCWAALIATVLLEMLTQ